jgi:hypothetical protein
MTLEIEREVKKFQGLRGCGCTLTGLEAHWKLTTNNLWQKCSLTGPCKKERHFLQATAEQPITSPSNMPDNRLGFVQLHKFLCTSTCTRGSVAFKHDFYA